MTKQTTKQQLKRTQQTTKKVVVISGDRNCKEKSLIIQELQQLNPEKHLIVTGGCQGVDKIAEEEAKGLGFEVVVEKAYWTNKNSKTFDKRLGYDPMAGPRRNQRMLDKYKPRKVLLFHNYIQGSKGTKDMMQRCLAACIPHTFHRTTPLK